METELMFKLSSADPFAAFLLSALLSDLTGEVLLLEDCDCGGTASDPTA